jgi:hypothetical protein
MKRISELDNLTDVQIQNTDLIETARPTVKNFKFTWLNLKTALTTLFDTLYSAIIHASEHETGGSDEINVVGLSGELADPQTPKTHAVSHLLTGSDEISVLPTTDQKAALPGTSGTPSATNKYVTNDDSRNTDTRTPKEHANEAHNPDFSEVGVASGIVNALTEKTTPVNDDLFIIEDSAASNAPKKVKLSNIPGAEYAEKVAYDFTYGETIAINDALYLKAADGKAWKADADFNDERIHNFIGFAKEAGNANDVKKVQVAGVVSGFTGLTAGSVYYLSNTAGAIATSTGAYEKMVGVATSATTLLITNMVDGAYAVGNDLLIKADAAKTTNSTGGAKLKEIYVGRTSNLRISFTLTSATGWAKGRIYKNASAVGTEQHVASGASTTFSEDISGWTVGDLCQIYVWVEGSGTTGTLTAFRLFVTKPKVFVDLLG